MLQPARRKYRKEQKGRNRGISHESGTSVSFGEYGLKAVGRGRLTARQIESARRAMTRHIKRGGRIWIRIFPDKPISQKPAEHDRTQRCANELSDNEARQIDRPNARKCVRKRPRDGNSWICKRG